MQVRAILLATMLMLVLLFPAVTPSAAERTIQEFVAVQQKGACATKGVPPCPAKQLFLPPVPNYVGWGGLQRGDQACTFEPGDICRFALVDYAGIAARFIEARGGPDLGTSFGGTVKERPVDKGLVEVTVRLVTRNALIFVSELSTYDVQTGPKSIFLTSPLLFGARPLDVLDGRKPALGSSVFEVTYIDKPGAPFPNLLALLTGPGPELKSYEFRAVTTGRLRAAFFGEPGKGGARGQVRIVQILNETEKVALRQLCPDDGAASDKDC
jgi:hypothetical protein